MSIGSASASLSLDEAIGACSELGRVLGAASSFAVSGWTREHIDNAFGWAEHVEGIMNQMVPDALAPELDKALDAMQKHAAEQERAQGSAQPMVPRVQLVLTVAKLQSARTLLLGLLLQNHAAPRIAGWSARPASPTRQNSRRARPGGGRLALEILGQGSVISRRDVCHTS